MGPERGQITELLLAWNGGDRRALEQLTSVIYDQLRALAASHMRREGAGHLLQPTALVHELYLRLFEQQKPALQNHYHFFAVVATTMRRILKDHAKAARAQKRGGDYSLVPLEEDSAACQPNSEILALDEALEALEAIDPRKAKVVELKFYGGLEMAEIAEHLGVAVPTIEKDWTLAKAWLARRLSQTV